MRRRARFLAAMLVMTPALARADDSPPPLANVVLHATDDRGVLQQETFGFYEAWTDVCKLPCDATLSIHNRFRVVGGESRTPFTLSGASREASIASSGPTRPWRIWGSVLTSVGGGAAFAGAWLAAQGQPILAEAVVTVAVSLVVTGLVFIASHGPRKYMLTESR